jgi:hypothetical protein
VGAGTGKATAAFAGHGLEILALEPSPDMAALAVRNCAAFSGVSVEVATFENWPGAGARFDLLIAAQSWHFLDPARRAPLAHGWLSAAGTLALFWNLPVWEDAALKEDLEEAYRRHAPQLCGSQAFPWQGGSEAAVLAAGELQESGLFARVTPRSFAWRMAYSTGQFLDLLLTHSDHRMLAERERWDLLSGVGEVLDARGGQIEMHYEARLYLARASSHDRRRGPGD